MSYRLTVESNKSIQFAMNGNPVNAPYAELLPEGHYLLNALPISNGFRFVRWADGQTNMERALDLTADTQLMVIYESATTVFWWAIALGIPLAVLIWGWKSGKI